MLSQVSWYVRKSVFAIFILFAYVYLSYFLALWIHLCVIRAHFWLRKKVVFLFHHPKNLIKWQCILIVVNCELLSVLESFFTFGKAEAKWILRLPCLSAFCVALENCYKHELAALVLLLKCSVDDSKIGFRMILAILKFLKEQWSCCCIFWCSQRSQLATLNVQKVLSLKFHYSNKRDFDSSSFLPSLLFLMMQRKIESIELLLHPILLLFPFYTPFFKLLIRL